MCWGTKCEFKNAQLSSFTSSERESLGSKNEYLSATDFDDDSREREREGKEKLTMRAQYYESVKCFKK